MMETASELARKWDIGAVQKIDPAHSGTSCISYILKTTNGKFILRGFTSEQQAKQESTVSQLLLGTGIGANLIPTFQGNYYVPYFGHYYNMQTFLPGIPPDFSDVRQVIAAGKATAKLHCALASYGDLFSNYDRFSTIPLLLKTKGMPLPASLFPEDVDTMENREKYILMLENLLSQSQVIHGDLGAWNMLWNGNTICMIDFGECRAGDTHFDLAALICSILSKCKTQESFSYSFAQLLDSYEGIAGPIDSHKLNISIYLWLLRGALASLTNNQDPIKRQKMSQHFADELMRFKLYTGPCDI